MSQCKTSLMSVALASLLLPAVALSMGQKPPKRPQEPPKLRPMKPKRGPVREPVLLEFFTSQGCSSCPPANANIAKLLRDPKLGRWVVPLSLHVDYWDGLGWKDPFSQPRWSARQRKYAAMRGSQQVATPAVVLNGQRKIAGQRLQSIQSAVRKLSREFMPGRIEITVQNAKLAARVSINAYLRRKVPGRRVHVVVALYEDGLMTDVLRGENAGHQLRHDRVVRYMEVVAKMETIGGSLTRKAVFVPLPANWKGRRYGVVAFLQAVPSMRVLGTTRVHFGFAGDLPTHTRKTRAHPPTSILHKPL